MPFQPRVAGHGMATMTFFFLGRWSSSLASRRRSQSPSMRAFRVALDAVGLAVEAHVTLGRRRASVQLDLDDVFWFGCLVRLRHDVQMQHAGRDESYEEQVAASYDALRLAALSHG